MRNWLKASFLSIIMVGLFVVSFFVLNPKIVFAINPQITSTSQDITLGQSNIEINGEGFGDIPGWVTINNYECMGGCLQNNIISWSDSRIVFFPNSYSWWFKLGSNTFRVTNNTNYNSNIFNINIISLGCEKDTWECSDWSECLVDEVHLDKYLGSYHGDRTRTCTKIIDCPLADTYEETIQTCTLHPVITSISPSVIYPHTKVTITGYNFGIAQPVVCFECLIKINNSRYSSYNDGNKKIDFTAPDSPTSGYITVVDKYGTESNQFPFTMTPCKEEDAWNCSEWSDCINSWSGQTRTCTKTSNTDCQKTYQYSPTTWQKCTPPAPSCTEDTYSCGDWSACSTNSSQYRICTKTFDCPTAQNSSPATSQNCKYTPPCTADTWECGGWGTCLPQGIQTRSCTKTFDCSSAKTASPATSQYCVAPNQPQQQTPTDNLGIANQNSIVQATVKLICPVSRTMASQGSGTVINSSGTILTNKHVIDGTGGCIVGFIDNYNDEPYFGDRQIADIYKISSDADVAILKLRNPNNKSLTFVDITQGNSNNLRLGDTMTTYGYPAKFGTNITYTSGDFSGVDGDYLKTTAIIEHGNSGGGAYLKNGVFMGIPTAVIKGSLNSMGYLLSINKINSWLNNSKTTYNYNNNNYSRVSAILEDIDLNTLDTLGLYIPGDETNSNATTEQKTITKQGNASLSNRLKGKLLLQVEQKGKIWYVNPSDGKKHEVTFANALSLFQKFATGITDANLNKIPLNTDKWISALGNSSKGKLFLQVEQNGKIWYIDFSGKRWEVTRANLMDLFRSLALGITDNDLNKIPADTSD